MPFCVAMSSSAGSYGLQVYLCSIIICTCCDPLSCGYGLHCMYGQPDHQCAAHRHHSANAQLLVLCFVTFSFYLVQQPCCQNLSVTAVHSACTTLTSLLQVTDRFKKTALNWKPGIVTVLSDCCRPRMSWLGLHRTQTPWLQLASQHHWCKALCNVRKMPKLCGRHLLTQFCKLPEMCMMQY